MSFATAFNPQQQQVFGLLQGGGAFTNPILGKTGLLSGNITSVLNNIPAANEALGFTSTLRSSLNGAILGLQTGNVNLIAHSTYMTANLPGLMAKSAAHQNITQVITGAVGCLDYLGAFGSIMDKGQGLLDKAAAALAEVMALINQGIAALAAGIAFVINKITTFVSDMAAMIAEELGLHALFDKVMGLYGDAVSLCNNLLNNPCAKAVINATATPNMRQALAIIT